MKGLTKLIAAKLKFKVPSYKLKSNQKKQNWAMVTMFIFIIAIWISVRINQRVNTYYNNECQQFEVRFDNMEYDFFHDHCHQNGNDCPASWLHRKDPIVYTAFNGIYKVYKEDGKIITKDERPQYYQNGLVGFDAYGKDSPPGKISYCGDIGAWVFSIERVNKGALDTDLSSCDWLMKSPQTDDYSLSMVPTQNWLVWTGVLEVSKRLNIYCVECEIGDPGSPLDLDCAYHGKCIDNKCICEEGWMGHQCETCASCTNLTIAVKEHNSNNSQKWDFARMNEDVPNSTKPMSVYNQPAYYRIRTYNDTSESSFTAHVFIYSGSRYVILRLDGTKAQAFDEIKSYFSTFHSTWDREGRSMPVAISEPSETNSPFKLNWINPITGKEKSVLFECPQTQQDICPSEFND